MSSESPASILYSSDGYELATISSAAIPANTRGILFEGSDGTNAHFVLVDSSGREIVVGAAASGSPVVGNPVLIAGSDGTNAHSLLTDASSRLVVVGAGVAGTPAGGVVTIQGVSGGTVVPVSGTVTANQGTTGTLGQSWFTQITDATHGPVAVKAASTAAVAADSALVVTLSPNNAASGFVTTAAPTYSNSTVNFLSLDTAGNLRVLANAGTGTFSVAGTGTAGTPNTGVVTVQGIAGGTAIPVSGTLTVDKSSTGTLTQVSAAASSTTLLASNANRVSATFYNNSTNILFLALNATAASTAYSIRIMPNSYYDLPITYTGAISGIWNGTNGNCQVTELT